MGRHRQYAGGQRPSDLKRKRGSVYQARIDKFDNGLLRLCEMERPKPLSQHFIAEQCGVSQMLVYRVERTARRKLLQKLRAIGVTPNRFRRGVIFSETL